MLTIIFILIVILLIEIAFSKNLINFFSSSATTITILSTICLYYGLDLLLVTVILVYVSVFLIFFLIILSLNWQHRSFNVTSNLHLLINFLIVVLSILISLCIEHNDVIGVVSEDNNVWVDSYLINSSDNSEITKIFHVLILNIFYVESVAINIFLLLGLIASIYLLANRSNLFVNRVTSALKVKRVGRRVNSLTSFFNKK